MKSLASAVAVCLLAALVLAACGGDSDSGSTASESANTTAETGGSSDSLVAEAEASVEKAREGTYSDPPSTGPAAQSGKDVWVISCGESAPGCSTLAAGAMEAGETLGWKMHLFDGKLTPTGWTAGFDKALAAGAEGIIPITMDCPPIKGSLEKAKQADVPVIGLYSFDCDDPSYTEKSPALYTEVVNVGKDLPSYFEEYGRVKADYAIAETDGKFKAINIVAPEYQSLQQINKGFVEQVEKCAECEIIETLEIPATQLATGEAAQRIETALGKNPDATVLNIPYDAMTLTVAQTLAGHEDMLILGFEGFEPNIELIKQGVQDLALPYEGSFSGWAAADTLNRYFAGETEFPPQGVGYQLIDIENAPKSGPAVATVDYKPIYEEVWNGK